MTQFLLTVPHDSAEEPTMASMDPAELEAALAAAEKFNTDLIIARGEEYPRSPPRLRVRARVSIHGTAGSSTGP